MSENRKDAYFVQDANLENVGIDDLHQSIKCVRIEKSKEREVFDPDELYELYYGTIT